MFANPFRKKLPKQINLDQIKARTAVLIIDDEEPTELRALLKRDNWKHYYIDDLESLEAKKLRDSQIICIDIMGVGKALRVENGMGLVKDIKIKYPGKKIILYSSVSKQNIFSEALDYVDKRLRKQSSLIPFVRAIEEMAENTFSWEATLRYAYAKLEDEVGDLIDFENFKRCAEKSIRKNGWDEKDFMKKAGVSLDVASKISALIALALES